MFKNKSNKQIEIILLVIVVAVFVSYYFVYVDIKKKNEHISSLQIDLLFQTDKEKYILLTERAIAAVKVDLDKVNSSVISTTGDVEFIEKLEALARNNGLTMAIDSLNLEEDPKAKNPLTTILKIKANTDGSWTGTYKFMNELESLPFKIKISQYALQGSSGIANEDGTKSISSQWHGTFEIRVLKSK